MRSFLFILALTVNTSAATADVTADAESWFVAGKRLIGEHRFTEACTAFETSHAIDPAATTLANLGDCRERNQQLASAFDVYLRVERELRLHGDEVSIQLRTVIKKRILQLAPRLSSLTIIVPTSATRIEVVRDEAPVDPDAWNRAQLIDGGIYTITARILGRPIWSARVSVSNERDQKTVRVPSLSTRSR